jgi:RNA polymerase sigma-70 factor, ECF subfamily
MLHNAVPTPRTPPDMTAWDLVTATQDGDRDAYGQLYLRYRDVVYRFVLTRLNNRSTAEDLTSETFLRALRRIDSVSYQGQDVGAWFVTIARNLVLDHVKSSRYQRETPTGEMLDSDARRGPESEVVSRVTSQTVRDCVARLSAAQREVVTLRYLRDLSVAETMAVIGCAEEATKGRQHRGLRELARMPELRDLVA